MDAWSIFLPRRLCPATWSDLKLEIVSRPTVSSQKLKDNGVQAVFDGKKILLQKPEEGVYAEGMMIVVGEQGEIDVNGRSLGPVRSADKATKKNELIVEIISHFSL